ncbi:MAG: YIP1 family protein [Chloroflexota bacterium]|jgi:hypothetical protein|nr:YIP1 family protein [Chloroflexota bacterium]
MDTTTSHVSPEAAQPTAERSLPRRILDTFVAPGELFASFGERPPWFGVLAISTLAVVAALALLPTELFVAQMREAMQARPDAPRMDVEAMGGFARISGIIGAGFSQFVGSAIVAGVLTLIFRMLMGGSGTFRQHLAVASHSSLIPALGALVTLPIQIARGDMGTRLSLALLAPFLDSDSFVYKILQGLEIFTLWWIAVVALGVAVVGRRTSWGTAAATLFGIYLVILMVTAALTS